MGSHGLTPIGVSTPLLSLCVVEEPLRPCRPCRSCARTAHTQLMSTLVDAALAATAARHVDRLTFADRDPESQASDPTLHSSPQMQRGLNSARPTPA